MEIFSPENLKKLYKPPLDSSKNDNGQVTIIGGSKLFHGAPLFGLTVASRVVDMVYFASPEPSAGRIAEQLKSKLFSFIWIPWDEAVSYVAKSDAVLIGSGFMRYGKGQAGEETREITREFLTKFPDKKWVIDAGSLQMIEKEWIPKNSILTPNKREYKMLFDSADPAKIAKKYNCILVIKGPSTFVYGPDEAIEVRGGNPGLTKGGTGDVQAGLTVALLAKNDPFLAASSAAYLVKKAGDELYKKSGIYYNADDLAKELGLYFPQKVR